MKLDDIAFVGDVKMLGKQAKDELRKRNYEFDEEKMKAEAKQEKPQSAFFAAQKAKVEAEERQRADRHLLPVEEFYRIDGSKVDKKEKLPYN